MKSICLSLLSACLLLSCAPSRPAGATPGTSGQPFTTWRESSLSPPVFLHGVTKTSTFNGPDFTVYYYTFEPKTTLAVYNGNHPQRNEDEAVARFHSPVGKRQAAWKMTRDGEGFQAECVEKAPEGFLWQATVSAPTAERVREVVDQLSSGRPASARPGRPQR